MASKFWEHFLYIANAMNHRGNDGIGLWDETDGFFYDVLQAPGRQHSIPMRVRSMVGLIPLFAVETMEPELLDRLPGFKRRMRVVHRQPARSGATTWRACAHAGWRNGDCSSIVGPDQLRRVLQAMLDEHEFLSPYGIRALSQYHRDHPYTLSREWHGVPR